MGSFYRLPWSDESYMGDFVATLKLFDKKGKGNIWIGGDFNLPHIDWKDEKILPGNHNVKISNMLIECIEDLSLTQTVEDPTRKDNILDLFFTTNPKLIK